MSTTHQHHRNWQMKQQRTRSQAVLNATWHASLHAYFLSSAALRRGRKRYAPRETARARPLSAHACTRLTQRVWQSCCPAKSAHTSMHTCAHAQRVRRVSACAEQRSDALCSPRPPCPGTRAASLAPAGCVSAAAPRALSPTRRVPRASAACAPSHTALAPPAQTRPRPARRSPPVRRNRHTRDARLSIPARAGCACSGSAARPGAQALLRSPLVSLACHLRSAASVCVPK
jgi:hypothetical protein